ncbi:Tetratricopeptide repeat-containing protein, partial [Candidatus Electrothrix aarhusensis]
ANTLGNYALFLMQQQRYDKAAEQYERAIAVSPEDANDLGNYAKLLFVQGNRTKAIEMLERSEKYQENWPDGLSLELAFYRYAHCQPQPITLLKKLMVDGIPSNLMNLEDNVRCAEQDGHSNPALLAALAKVISYNEPIEILEQFPEWSEAND